MQAAHRGPPERVDLRDSPSAFILLLGSGLCPISGGSEEAFANQVLNVLIGTAYAVVALSIAAHDTARVNAPRLASRRADF